MDEKYLKNVPLYSLLGLSGVIGTVWMSRTIIRKITNSILHRIMVDTYSENLWEFITASKKVGLQNIVETNLRTQEGKTIKRPLGSPRKYPDFDKVMFNFAQLSKLPTNERAFIDTRVIIGPLAKKPMQIEIPIMVTGMAYGFSLSAKTKVALAKGTRIAGTATNTGEGPFLPQERKEAGKLIIQYSRGSKWFRTEKKLNLADMVEIHLGQGAAGGIGHYIEDKEIDCKIKKMLGLQKKEKVVVHSRFPGMTGTTYLKNLINYLREVTDGVPIGVKMAAGKYLEDDLDIAVESGVDYIAIDGCEAGTRGSAPILQDDFGLPTLFALIRADNYFRKHNLKGKISLIVSGGLVNPGHYLKALALGADAVYIGTIALFAMAHTEVLKALPWEPPPDVVWYKGKASHKLNVNKGAQNISKYLLSCNHEMKDGIIALGKRSIQQLDKEDLFALDHYTSEIVGIPVGYKEIHY